MNLHELVRGFIPIVNPDETVQWYRNVGQSHGDYGVVTPVFAEPVSAVAQVQSESDASLYYQNRAGDNSIVRRCYMMGDEPVQPAGIVRPQARGGDVIRRADGSWWLVNGVIDDFSLQSGWVCVRMVLQSERPDGIPDPDAPAPGAGGGNGGD